ncbi:hypothetical protein TELCIR_03785 [Teladorsagia circumcincta]|uniref:Uncharacterized protein n=1 Tax=Teladorsagia circumcincta TaxID=45464 RepID=A0A2G9UVF4_TELCI|nr:hypothetical protein TELCIR_03785 [Teladorsagia circumcincta]
MLRWGCGCECIRTGSETRWLEWGWTAPNQVGAREHRLRWYEPGQERDDKGNPMEGRAAALADVAEAERKTRSILDSDLYDRVSYLNLMNQCRDRDTNRKDTQRRARDE